MHEHLPEPTVWPSVLASGVTLAAMGLVSSPFVFVAGALLTLISIAAWVRLLVRSDT